MGRLLPRRANAARARCLWLCISGYVRRDAESQEETGTVELMDKPSPVAATRRSGQTRGLTRRVERRAEARSARNRASENLGLVLHGAARTRRWGRARAGQHGQQQQRRTCRPKHVNAQPPRNSAVHSRYSRCARKGCANAADAFTPAPKGTAACCTPTQLKRPYADM